MSEEGKKENTNIPIRNNQVQAILDAMPRWTIRLGNTLVLILILGLLVISYIIKYPDVVIAGINIYSANPPLEIDIKKEGTFVTFLVENKCNVKKGQLLATTNAPNSYQEVVLLKELLDSTIFEEITPTLLNSISTSGLDNLSPAYILFWQDIAELHKKRNRENLKNTIESYNALKKEVSVWDSTYLIRAPIDGRVHIPDKFPQNRSNSLVLRIIPKGDNPIDCIAEFAAQDFTKIQYGQDIQFNIPILEDQKNAVIFGTLNTKSVTINDEGLYIVQVELDSTTTDFLRNELNKGHNLNREVKIVTKNTRLIERFLPKIIDLFK